MLAIIVGFVGCGKQESNVSSAQQGNSPQHPLPGTNAGSQPQLTADVSGWTYHLMGGQNRIAAYQFNGHGTVVATVGTVGNLDYPALFWRIDEKDQIVVASDRRFREIVELWTILSIDDSEVTVQNAMNDREEIYWRKQHWPPSSRDSTHGDDLPDA